MHPGWMQYARERERKGRYLKYGVYLSSTHTTHTTHLSDAGRQLL